MPGSAANAGGVDAIYSWIALFGLVAGVYMPIPPEGKIRAESTGDRLHPLRCRVCRHGNQVRHTSASRMSAHTRPTFMIRQIHQSSPNALLIVLATIKGKSLAVRDTIGNNCNKL